MTKDYPLLDDSGINLLIERLQDPHLKPRTVIYLNTDVSANTQWIVDKFSLPQYKESKQYLFNNQEIVDYLVYPEDLS